MAQTIAPPTAAEIQASEASTRLFIEDVKKLATAAQSAIARGDSCATVGWLDEVAKALFDAQVSAATWDKRRHS